MRFPFPGFIQFYPTFRCNQNCSFCFNDPSQDGEMSFDNALRLLDILCQYHIGEIDIMGGEPLLLDWMPDFVGAAVGKGVSVNMSTNGSNPDVIGRFREFYVDKVAVGLSLEGSTEERHNRLTGSRNYSAVLKSIDLLSSSGFSPIVKTVVSRKTMGDIQAIADFLKRRGVRQYYLIHMDLLSRKRSLRPAALSYPAFLSFYEDIRRANPDMSILRVNASCFERNTLPAGVRCAGGVRKLAVMPDGSVYPCNLFHGMRSFMLGNIFEADMPVIWENPALDLFRYAAGNSCGAGNCSNHASCTGGCPAHGYFYHRNPLGGDVRCLLQHSAHRKT